MPQTAQLEHLLGDIGARSQSLWERISAAREVGGDPLPPEALHERLNPWVRVFSRGDRLAFLRRLGWDAIDPQLAAQALAPASAEDPAPPWTRQLARYASRAAATVEPVLRESARSADEPVPFVELWLPWIDLAMERLEAADGAQLDLVAPAARADLARLLLSDIARLSEVAAYERFSRLREEREGEVAGLYRRFVADCLADPLGQLYGHFPVLARQTCRLLDQWQEMVIELTTRLERDRGEIGVLLGDGEAPGRLLAVRGGVSDRHHGGRQVLLLELESGLRVVYKPRSVASEQALARLFDWCAHHGLEPPLRSARVLARAEYGWMELVEQDRLQSEEAARDYYRRAGSLLAIAYALRAEDLHGENLVATAQGPVVVDAEMILQPVRERLTTGEESDAPAKPGSCLATGLLTQLLPDGRENRDLGGLRAPVERRSARRIWREPNTDRMELTTGEQTSGPLKNAVFVGDALVGPESFAPEAAEGFARAYRFLLSRRAALLAEDGPVAALREVPVRVLFRSSQEYGRVLQLSALPRHQRSGLSTSWLQEAMLHPFAELDARPVLWPIVREERTALEAGDVPWFCMLAGDTRLRAPAGEPLEGVFAVSGLDAVRSRIATLSEEDLERQLGLLRLALEPPVSRPAALLAALRQTEDEADARESDLASCRRLATVLADELAGACAGSGGRELRWDLGSGLLGPALFLAGMFAGSRDSRYSEAARGLLEPLLDGSASGKWSAAERQLSLGGFSGIGSVIWGLVWSSRLLGEPALLEAADRAADWIDDERVEADRAFDLDRGAAGAIVGLLALFEATGEPRYLRSARRCGDHLLANQRVTSSAGAGWKNPAGLVQTGWAHGVAGIAAALGTLAARLSEERYLVAAAAALGHERALFDGDRRNWPVLLTDSTGSRRIRSWMVAGCRGAPGVALSRLRLHDVLADAALEAECELALDTTATSPVSALDHLCCGNLGRSSVLLTASLRADWAPESSATRLESARGLARATLSRAAANGGFTVSADCYENRRLQPGLLHGLAGIGYQLLRLAGDEELPDVLGLELPSEHSRRVEGREP